MADIPELTDATFDDEVLASKIPVVVDFGADWCHPCKQLDPVVEQLAEEWKGRITFRKVNADVNLNTTSRFGVFGLPTLILFKDGEPRERLMGFQSKGRILKEFGPHLGV